MSTVSSEKRPYRMQARAEAQERTRNRIAVAAAELHEEKGVAATTVADVARRAGVQRLTVYNHFADLSELIPACAAHYAEEHPRPDLEDALALEDPPKRTREVLLRLYGWFRETEPMYGKLLSDRASVPELDRFLVGEVDRPGAELAAELAGGFGARGRRLERLRTLARLAVDFWTWRRLDGEGLDDEAAADLMAAAIAAQ